MRAAEVEDERPMTPGAGGNMGRFTAAGREVRRGEGGAEEAQAVELAGEIDGARCSAAKRSTRAE